MTDDTTPPDFGLQEFTRGVGVPKRVDPPKYYPETCCACRWVAWGEDCGHGPSDGIDSPHDHCEMHSGR